MITALGWIGAVLVVLSLAQRDLSRLRRTSLAGALVLLVFNLVTGVASLVFLNLALAGVNVWRLRLEARSRDAAPAPRDPRQGPARGPVPAGVRR